MAHSAAQVQLEGELRQAQAELAQVKANLDAEMLSFTSRPPPDPAEPAAEMAQLFQQSAEAVVELSVVTQIQEEAKEVQGKLEAECEAAKQELQNMKAELESMAARHAVEAAEATERHQALTSQQEQDARAELETKLEAAKAETASVQSQLTALHAECVDQRQAATEASGEKAELEADLAEVRQELTSELAEAHAELAVLKGGQSEEAHELAANQAALEEMQQAVREAEGRAEGLLEADAASKTVLSMTQTK